MDLIFLKVIFLIGIFVLMLVCMLLPLRIFPRDPSKQVNRKSQRIMSFCNCFSGGVFLSTCYVGLIPFIEEKFSQIFLEVNLKVDYPVTELIVMVGFFLILLLEQCIHVWQDARHAKEETEEMLKFPNEYIIYDSDSTVSEDTEVEEGELNHFARPKSPQITPSTPQQNGGSRPVGQRDLSASRASRGHGHGHSHGHSHSHAVELVEGKFGLRCLILLLALSIHGVFEGLAVGLQDHVGKLIHLYIAVLVHECLVSFAAGVSLAQQKINVGTAVKLAILFCMMIPIGMGFGMLIGKWASFGGQVTSAVIQALAAGTFVYVVFLEIIPAEFHGKEDRLLKVLFLFLGFVLIACLRVAVRN